jgi:integrase/recombinase XerC
MLFLWYNISGDYMDKHIQSFLDYLRIQRGYSNETIINYKKDIDDFLTFLQDHQISYNKLTYQDIRTYLVKLHECKYKRTTVSRHISSLRSFYKYLSKENIIADNPFLLVSLPKKEKKLVLLLKFIPRMN